jgi:adenosine deaminase
VERGVVIEACPTSNWHVGILAAPHEHPLAQWLEAGLRVAVCTDNTLMSAVDLPTELSRVGATAGSERWALLQAHARAGAFARH